MRGSSAHPSELTGRRHELTAKEVGEGAGVEHARRQREGIRVNHPLQIRKTCVQRPLRGVARTSSDAACIIETPGGLSYPGPKDRPMALSRLLPRPNRRASSTKGRQVSKVIAFANQKGGVAKTTTTLNLGVALSEQGFNVLLVDLDPQGNLTMSQGWNPDEIERSMFDVLVHQLPITEIIRTNEVDVAVSSIDLAGAELALSSMIGRERALEKALVSVKPKYDYILIDTPPSLGLLTINALVASNGVIVPVQCEYLSLRGLVQLENT